MAFRKLLQPMEGFSWSPGREDWNADQQWIGVLRRLGLRFGKDVVMKYHERLYDNFRHSLEKCGSPIEYALLPVFFGYNWPMNGKSVMLSYCKDDIELTKSKGRVSMMNQAPFYGYRTDFTFKFMRHGTPVFMCVEADGKAYHDKDYDKERDDELKRRGVYTLRFAGSIIVKDPVSCAERINFVATELETTGKFVGYAA